MIKNETATTESEPVELRPRTMADGRIDLATVRWTIEHMHDELAQKPQLGRVRNALAIALLELDRAQRDTRAITAEDLGPSRYLPWTTKRT
ncbi:MAG: hypothetical protein J0I57_04795 [Hyphomicrobium sp.]|uniref:hypothetical protein n=1 Tax=Hyphomicrobium sp. CS1BSMeth3 TaxID=1892844 RepID=UPI000931E88D|nr:hypothetical protein [Hyphomicrobium sp. CS1BSMeth3]MBN9260307.1 hypothetical protein [Hyphomicrobium sp.]MBN9266070.1 hypothetical protein [Hyphomicrobium sp.]MBN9276935.1 hypothetical protein [Hyphomicrobium sp.]